MDFTFSLNGPDNVGKTTQASLLPNIVTKMGSLLIREMPNSNATQWWFRDCPTPEFTRHIVKAFEQREMKKNATGVNVLDRGLLMFKAVCAATAAIKDGISLEDAFEAVDNIFDKTIEEKEDLHVFLYNGETPKSSLEELEKREERSWDHTYKSYQIKLREAINYVTHSHPDKVVRVNCEGKSVIKVHNEIRSIIHAHLQKSGRPELAQHFRPILDKVRCIIGLGGMSESGKSFSGQYLHSKYNFIRMKKIYFDEIATLISGSSIYERPVEEAALMLVIELARFCSAHYYFPYFTMESLRDFAVTKELKKLLGSKFVIVYLDAPEEIRFQRGTPEENAVFQEKDKTKKINGANKIKDIADYVIQNESSIENLKLSLEEVLNKELNFKTP